MKRTVFDPATEPLDGPKLIEASAGTGKTYSITSLYLRFLLEARLSVDQILVVTFTETATAELRIKIRTRIAEAIAYLHLDAQTQTKSDPGLVACLRCAQTPQQALRDLSAALNAFDDAAIFTIHGFCHRMLRDVAFDGGFPFDSELITDQRPFLEELVRDFLTQALTDGPADLVDFVTSKKRVQESSLRLAELVMRHEDVHLVPNHPVVDAFAEDPDLRNGLFAALESVADMWRRERPEIHRHLVQAIDQKDLKANVYKREKVDSWVREMDAYLNQVPCTPTAFPHDAMAAFSRTKLKNATKKKRACPSHRFFHVCDTLIDAERLYRDHLTARFVALRIELVSFVRDQARIRRKRQNILFFEDLLRDMKAALYGAKADQLIQAVRARFKAALIDEFQDTSRIQYQIFNTLFSQDTDHLFLIGDPKQAIYGFRNADIYTYLEAVRDARKKIVTLTKNWRSDAPLVEAVNHLFSRCTNPFHFPEIPFSPVNAEHRNSRFSSDDVNPAPVGFLLVRSPEIDPKSQVPKAITSGVAGDLLPTILACHIENLMRTSSQIEGNPVQPGDIAVLVRTNRQAQQIQSGLRARRIPSVIFTQGDVLTSHEADELIRIMVSVADPGHTGRLRAALTTHALGFDAGELDRLTQDDNAWAAVVNAFRTYQSLWHERGFIAMIRHLAYRQDVLERLVGFPDGERRITNWNHLIELLHAQSRRENLGPRELVSWLLKQRAGPGGIEEMRLESDAAAIQIVTMHRCKGMEYPIVYCPYLWEGAHQSKDKSVLLYHDPNHDDRLTIDLSPEPSTTARAQARFERDAEGMRLLYVALTRAKHRMFLLWGSFNRMQGAPLTSLLHPPDDQVPTASTVNSQARVLGFKDPFIRQDVAELVSARPDLFSMESVDAEFAPPPIDDRADEAEVALRHLPPGSPMRVWRRLGSFSSLISRDTPSDRDHDQIEGTDDVAPASPAPLDQPNRHTSLLAEFPKGARAGECLHKVFEQTDFQHISGAPFETMVAEELAHFGFDPVSWSPGVIQAIETIVATPLQAGSHAFHLNDIPADQRVNEMEFVACVGGNPGAYEHNQSLTGGFISRVFAQHASSGPIRAYAHRLKKLSISPLTGFLKGFIDMVLVKDDRWYVVDYKSNFLGPELADYGPGRLVEAMGEHHYFLQYHIYSLALHRYLGQRLSDYTFDRHFGGVFYLFLRGMSPDTSGQTGVFFDRPSEALIDALSTLSVTGSEES